MSSSDIFMLRKQGRSGDALMKAREGFAQNREDVWFLRAYAWTLYDHVKKIVEAYEAKQLSPAALSSQLTPYMREFSKFANLLRKDSAFSQMLRQAGKVSHDWPEFLGFARWVGISDFSEEDCSPFINEQGKKIDSLKVRFIRAICREAVARATDPNSAPALIKWGADVLCNALQESPNDQWLNYYQSKLHLVEGDAEHAIQRLMPVLHRQSKAAWTWALLGEILESARPVDAITCYGHATQLAREEQEVAKIRIHLALRLSLEGRLNEAAEQASLALKYREKHGYKVPQDLAQLVASDWYQQAVANKSLQKLPKMKAEAQMLLQEFDQQRLVYTTGVIDHINTEKALSYVATDATKGFILLHHKFPQVADLPPGVLIDVGFAKQDGPPLAWRSSEATVIPGLCETFIGILEKQEGKDFAFIRTQSGTVFVPPVLAKTFSEGLTYQVTTLAIKRTNKQGKVRWRAVTVNMQGGDSQPSVIE